MAGKRQASDEIAAAVSRRLSADQIGAPGSVRTLPAPVGGLEGWA